MKTQLRSRASGSAVFLRFLAYFCVGASLGLAALVTFDYQRAESEHAKLLHGDSLRLSLISRTMTRDLTAVVADLRWMARTQALLDYVDDDTPRNAQRLAAAFRNLALHASIYDQLRYIDRSGRERVRISFKDGTPAVVPEALLQDKSGRYYVAAGLALGDGEIYLSPLDLNVQGGVIERPFKPMIRAAMPVFRRDGGRAGIVVLNYLAAHTLSHFAEIMEGGWGTAMLLNAQGYWLSAANPDDEWGFMLGNERTFALRHPLAWRTIAAQATGTLRNAEGLFVFSTLDPRAAAGLPPLGAGDDRSAWKVVSRVAPEALEFSPARSLREHARVVAWLVLLVAMLSYALAWLRANVIHKAAALQDSERSLAEAQHLARLGNWVLDVQSGKLAWSDEIYRIFGVEPKSFDATYAGFLERVHADDRAAVEEAVSAALEHTHAYAIEHRIVLPDGGVRVVQEHATVQLDASGRPLRMLGTVQDVTESAHAAQALRASEARHRNLFSNMAEGYALLGMVPDVADGRPRDFRYLEVNPAFERILGLRHEDVVGRTVLEVLPDTELYWLEVFGRVALSGHAERLEEFGGTFGRYFEITASCPEHGLVAVFFADVSERRRAENRLRQAATVFDNTMEAILIANADGNIVAVNRAYTQITGFAPEDVLGRNPRVQKSGRHDPGFYDDLWQSLQRTGQWQGEIWNRRKNGELFPAWENISVVKDAHGNVASYVSVMSDISPIKAAEERLSHQAHHDALTGLPNRLMFTANLEQALERGKRHRRKVALLFLDLDHFKLINDTLGHAAGDRLLQTIAERLKNSVRAEDMVARLGGDEFTVVLEELPHADDAALLAHKIMHAVVAPMQLDGRNVVISASIGISVFPDDSDNAGGLAKAADAAMYRAKGRGRNTCEFYTSELTTQAMERLSIEGGLREALAQDQFTLFYQPQIDVATGRLSGLEALLRWQHPDRGMLMPASFIGIAEESGLIDAIGNWVLAKACAQARSWRDAGLPPIRIAINISGRQIMYDHLAEKIQQALEENRLAPGDVLCQLEITESVLHTGEKVTHTLKRLRQMGLSIAIDDFGTGYSSLGHLKQLPIDTLKIDRAFMRGVPDDADNRSIVAAIVLMAHSLGLRVIAEGAETMEQFAFLREQGCDEMQGFLVSRPLDGTDTAELLARCRNQPLRFGPQINGSVHGARHGDDETRMEPSPPV